MPNETEIDIHIKAKNAEEAKRQLDELRKKFGQVGDDTEKSQKKGAEAADKHTQKLGGLSRVMSSLHTQVAGLLAGFLSLAVVQKIFDFLARRMENMAAAMREVNQQSLKLQQIGQALEFQTGTVGKQRDWAKTASDVQKAGALESPSVAQQMLISADIAFAKQGGIKNPAIIELVKQLAPMAGAGLLAPEQVAKFFEFAGAAQIEAAPDAYKDYFAKLRAGFTASKATNFGDFMIGLQKGATGYLAQGGTLTEAIAAFSSARSVMASEELAATLLEQTARLSGGGYERPRQAIERGVGVKWADINMDQRLAAVLKYVASIPEAQRTQKLVEQGFPAELASQVSKMVSPEASAVMASTRDAVKAASSSQIEEMSRAYMESAPAKEQAAMAAADAQKLAASPAFEAWDRRRKIAEEQFKVLYSQHRDRAVIPDKVEPDVMAYEQMIKEFEAFAPSASDPQAAAMLLRDMKLNVRALKLMPWTQVRSMLYPTFAYHTGAKAEDPLRAAPKLFEKAESMMSDPNAGGVTIINDNSMNYSIGPRTERTGPRSAPPGGG